MDPGLELRPARLEDAAGIAALSGQLGYPATPDEIRTRLATTLAAPALHAVFVTSKADAPIGWIHVMRIDRLESLPHGEIAALVVAEGHRNQDIGARLIDTAARWTRDQGLASLTVRSRVERESAHRFYRRMGFEVVKTQRVMELDVSRW